MTVRPVKSLRTSPINRAIIGVMVYSFASVGAVVRMKIADYCDDGRRSWLPFHGKGGKRHESHCHHKLEDYLDEYIKVPGKSADPKR